MELVLQIVNQFLIPAFFVLVTGLVAYACNYVKKLYSEFVTNNTVKEIVEISVKYVEQKYKDLHGSDKYDKALEKIESLLAQKGIEVDREQIDALIESSVYTFTNSFVDLEEIPEETIEE